MRTVILTRFKQDDKQTTGRLEVFDSEGFLLFSSICIERGWLDNAQNISCIPEGCYPIELEYSPKFDRDLWEIKEVPNRSECKIHTANYASQLNGCIAPGFRLAYLNNDRAFDACLSGNTLEQFHIVMRGTLKADIIIQCTEGLSNIV